MKTIREIKQEMNEIMTKISTETDMKPRTKSALTKRIVHLRICLKYLETHPNPEYLQHAIETVETKITNRMMGFEYPKDIDKLPKGRKTKLKRDWEHENGVVLLREQVRTLRYLLK